MMCCIIVTAVAIYTPLDQAASHTTGVVRRGDGKLFLQLVHNSGAFLSCVFKVSCMCDIWLSIDDSNWSYISANNEF